jgi:hypothetical protein
VSDWRKQATQDNKIYAGTNGFKCRLTEQRLRSGSVEVAGLSICRVLIMEHVAAGGDLL